LLAPNFTVVILIFIVINVIYKNKSFFKNILLFNDGLQIEEIKYEKKGRKLEFIIYNTLSIYVSQIYEPLFHTLMNNKEFTDWIRDEGGIMISTAVDGLIQFQLHDNFYIEINTPVNEFINETTLNRERLTNTKWGEGSPGIDVIIDYIIVNVWKVKSEVKRPENYPMFIKKHSFHTSALNNSSLNFTPLQNKINKKDLLNIAAMDIETIDYAGNQIPVFLSCAYIDNKNRRKVKVFNSLIDPLQLNLNSNKAVENLWKDFFKNIQTYLIHNTVVFMHNLGKFDGYLIFNAILKYNLIHYKNINCLIDKQHKFIQIKAKFNNINIIWKDSMRIFPTSLENLCTVFETENTKLGKYRKKFNSIELFNNPTLLKEFLAYAKSDPIALLNVMLNAQKIYFKNYNIDIASILSASTLSLKIYRTRFQNNTILGLNKTLDFYIRKSYYGGATDIYKQYGENLYYYDVNSLYSKAMLNMLPFRNQSMEH